jgi:excisionase family DNA binding protein
MISPDNHASQAKPVSHTKWDAKCTAMCQTSILSSAVAEDSIPPRPALTISVAQAAQLLGVGESAVYSAVKRGDIEAIRVGKLIRVMRAPLLAMLGLPEDYEID